MPKITFMGAGSTVFARNVLGDSMLTPALEESRIALYDIDAVRLDDSFQMLQAINRNNGSKARIEKYLGTENRKEALRGASYVVNAIQVGGYDPCTITDFEIPKKYGLKPIGTYAHEFVQMYQGIDSIPLAYTNHYALEDWYNEYKGDNGTALTDTVTTDLFLLDFNRAMVNNFTGVRHDSGDPYEWGEKIIEHYKSYGADPKTKLLLFSDSLDFDRAQKLFDHFKDRAKVSFGIGTFCSNDTDEQPLNIVIKLQTVNGRAVAKLSDSAGKTMCRDDEYMEYLERSVAFRLNREKSEY